MEEEELMTVVRCEAKCKIWRLYLEGRPRQPSICSQLLFVLRFLLTFLFSFFLSSFSSSSTSFLTFLLFLLNLFPHLPPYPQPSSSPSSLSSSTSFLTFFLFLFRQVYLHGITRIHHSKFICVPFVGLGVLSLALCCGLARFGRNHSWWIDVVVGQLAGALMALYLVRTSLISKLPFGGTLLKFSYWNDHIF